jgi:Tol biopolymer transport system component
VSYEGSAYLNVAGADGIPLHKVLLANDPLSAVAFALSPDGRQVAWVRPVVPDAGSPSAGVELWVAPASGEQGLDVRIVPAPTVPGAFFVSLAWSPDGRQIAFATFVRDPLTGDGKRTSIDLVNADGSGLRRLTTRPGLLGDLIAWSPDGRSLAYTGSADSPTAASSGLGGTVAPSGDVFVIGADGTGEQKVTNNPLTERLPQWSPNGAFLAYLTDGPGDSHHVTTLEVGGSAPRGAPSVGPASEWFVWSPDGRELLWQEITPLGPEASRSTVHAIDPEFKGPSRTVKVIDGLIVCTPSWQRLEP